LKISSLKTVKKSLVERPPSPKRSVSWSKVKKETGFFSSQERGPYQGTMGFESQENSNWG